jgi:hypothetical protein
MLAFLEYYLQNGADLSTEVGYISLSSAAYEESLANIREAALQATGR